MNPAKALGEAVSSLADSAVDRVLAAPARVRSANEGMAILAGQEGAEGLADQIQRVALLAVPVMRLVARGSRLSRVPWALVASTGISIGVAVHTGVRELQVLSSLVAHRLEAAAGGSTDPALVKKVTVDLYLWPDRPTDLADRRLRLGRLARRWIFSGAFARETAGDAARSLRAAERLDGRALAAAWADVEH